MTEFSQISSDFLDQICLKLTYSTDYKYELYKLGDFVANLTIFVVVS